MKKSKLLILVCAIGTMIGFSACGSKTEKNTESFNLDSDTTEVPAIVEEVTDVTEEGVSESDKSRACSELKSYGAKDAYFEDDYLCYVVSESDLSASPYEVGKALYPMFEDIQGLKGIKIVSANNHTILETYPN